MTDFHTPTDEHIKQVRDMLAEDKLPGKFDMGRTCVKTYSHETGECGTAGCIGGWAFLCANQDHAWDKLRRRAAGYVYAVDREGLGGPDYSWRLAELYFINSGRICLDNVTPAQAVIAIDNYLNPECPTSEIWAHAA